jgi:hypothetical protein
MPPTARALSYDDIHAALHRLARGGRASAPEVPTAQLLRFWLWGTDANEDCEHVKCEYHQMHLTGMVCGMTLLELYEGRGPSGAAAVIFNDDDAWTLIDTCAMYLPHCYTAGATADAAAAAAAPVAAGPAGGGEEEEEEEAATAANLGGSRRLLPSADAVHVPTAVTLQELRDLVQAVQTQWPRVERALGACATRGERLQLLQVVDRMMNQLFVWFTGYLFCSEIPSWQADDTEFVGPTPPTHALALTDMGVKFFLNIFFVLYRLLYLQRHAVAAPRRPASAPGGYPFSVETFHVEAGVDDFHMLGMYHDTPPGCLLEYKHSYSGYYNNVSQCVYRHFPSYKQRQVPTIEQVLAHDAADLYVVPALKQIYPEIEFAFEDHHFSREVAGVRHAVLLQEHSAVPPRAPAWLAAAPAAAAAVAAAEAPLPCVSDSLSRRVAACLGSGGDTGGGGAAAGADGEPEHRAKEAPWRWFCIGASVYLVCNTDGVVYSGRSRDLLALYLGGPR